MDSLYSGEATSVRPMAIWMTLYSRSASSMTLSRDLPPHSNNHSRVRENRVTCRSTVSGDRSETSGPRETRRRQRSGSKANQARPGPGPRPLDGPRTALACHRLAPGQLPFREQAAHACETLTNDGLRACSYVDSRCRLLRPSREAETADRGARRRQGPRGSRRRSSSIVMWRRKLLQLKTAAASVLSRQDLMLVHARASGMWAEQRPGRSAPAWASAECSRVPLLM